MNGGLDINWEGPVRQVWDSSLFEDLEVAEPSESGACLGVNPVTGGLEGK